MSAVCLHSCRKFNCLFAYLKVHQLFVYIVAVNSAVCLHIRRCISCLFTLRAIITKQMSPVYLHIIMNVNCLFTYLKMCQLFVYLLLELSQSKIIQFLRQKLTSGFFIFSARKFKWDFLKFLKHYAHKDYEKCSIALMNRHHLFPLHSSNAFSFIDFSYFFTSEVNKGQREIKTVEV